MDTRIHDGRGQAGVGLIEVLIAVLVLSIGFLGMAALQSKALSNNNSAIARTQATLASYSIIDAMRADRDRAVSGVYNGDVEADSCPAGNANIADVHLADWCATLATTMGNPAATTGNIDCDADGNCTVTITFDDEKASGGAAAQQVITRAQI